jgi:DNA-binding NarL/FixJ family response regulator
VLKLLAQGYTNKEAGAQLRVSVKTIETYRARIVDKLGLRSRADLTRYALEMGLLNPVASSPR